MKNRSMYKINWLIVLIVFENTMLRRKVTEGWGTLFDAKPNNLYFHKILLD
jgi:hypothetical protein